MAKSSPKAAEADPLQSFVPVTDFVGWPFGPEHPIHFRAGIPSTPVPASYISSLSDKKTASDKAE